MDITYSHYYNYNTTLSPTLTKLNSKFSFQKISNFPLQKLKAEGVKNLHSFVFRFSSDLFSFQIILHLT